MLLKTPLLAFTFSASFTRGNWSGLRTSRGHCFFKTASWVGKEHVSKWKHLRQCWKALSLSGMKTGNFLLYISASNIHLFLCSNGRCMTWVHEGTSKSRKCTSRAKSCPSPRHGKGSEKNKNGPFWPWNFLEIQQNRQNRWKVYEISWCFLFLCFLADTWSLCLFAFRCPWSNVQRAARGALTEQSCHVSDLFLENGQTSVRKSKVHENPRRIQKVTTDALQWLTN